MACEESPCVDTVKLITICNRNVNSIHLMKGKAFSLKPKAVATWYQSEKKNLDRGFESRSNYGAYIFAFLGFKEIGCECVNFWFHVALGRVKCRAIANTAVNFRVPCVAGIWLNSSMRTWIYGINLVTYV
jgi:hypothetical protein